MNHLSGVRESELILSIALKVDPLIQRFKEQAALFAAGTIIREEPITPWAIITWDFHDEEDDPTMGTLIPESPLVQDYYRLLETLNGNAIYQSSLKEGGISIALTALLKINGYRVIFVPPAIGNIPQVKVIKISEKMDYLPLPYTIVRELPFGDTVHRLVDNIIGCLPKDESSAQLKH